MDIPNRRLELKIDEGEFKERLEQWQPSKPKLNRGILGAYALLTEPAQRGAAFKARFE